MTTTITVALTTTHTRVRTVAELHGLKPDSIIEQPGARPLTIMEVADSEENRVRVQAISKVLYDHLLSVRVETLYLGGAR